MRRCLRNRKPTFCGLTVYIYSLFMGIIGQRLYTRMWIATYSEIVKHHINTCSKLTETNQYEFGRKMPLEIKPIWLVEEITCKWRCGTRWNGGQWNPILKRNQNDWLGNQYMEGNFYNLENIIQLLKGLPCSLVVWNTKKLISQNLKKQEGPEGPGSLTWGKGQRSQWSHLQRATNVAHQI